jgi:iron complex transport system ATP-binding protein
VILEIRRLSYSYDQVKVLNAVTSRISEPITAIIGPNGAGKSTLLRCLAGILPTIGCVFFDGSDIRTFGENERATLISYLPQQLTAGGALTVFESVLLGRVRSLRWRVGEDDLDKTYAALRSLGIEDLAKRFLSDLSGGEKQSAAIARSLVSEPRLLLMDEFTNNLDIRHKLELFELIRKITDQSGIVTILALHDINFAARFADAVLVLDRGHIQACGPPSDVITADLLRKVYGIEARVERGENGNVPFIVPLYPTEERSTV